MHSFKYIPLQESRKAIAMIELIFAIVIMGITMMSAPMLIDRATKSSYVALQQESIAAGTTQLAMVMTKAWDNADINTSNYIPILQTNSGAGAGAVLQNCTSDNPLGVSMAIARYCRDTAITSSFYTATPIGQEDANFDDIDDYNGSTSIVSIYNAENATSDYIDKDINITTNVYYGDDTPRRVNNNPSAGGYDRDIDFSNPFRNTSATTTHIKLITITLTSDNSAAELNDKNIFLSAFMCNIGAPQEFINNKAGL